MNKSVSEKLDEGWRMMCPEKHHTLEDQVGPTVYCEQCNCAYRYDDLIDKVELDNSGQDYQLF